MNSWRERILNELQPGYARLTLVADPDGLLTEEGTLKAIQERGFDLLTYENPVAFRFLYESQYRHLWDEGQTKELIVVLQASKQRLQALPFDLLAAGRQLHFALHQVFPKLSYPVIAALNRSYLDRLYQGCQSYDGQPMGEGQTKEFVLRHCFGVDFTFVSNPVDLLRFLLSHHYRKETMPESLGTFLLEHLEQKEELRGWPLADVLPNRERFFQFLQEQWERYVQSPSSNSSLCPFDHPDVRAYVDTLFLEGLLKPVESKASSSLPEWAQIGVVGEQQSESLHRFHRLQERFTEQFPAEDALHRDWQQVARKWAELVLLRWEVDKDIDDNNRQEWDRLHGKVEAAFADWMVKNFGTLSSLPYSPEPVMVHHVPHFLAMQRNRENLHKIALVVVDGLALDQWLLLRKHLEDEKPGWTVEESSIFAWVPTLTSISRQALFAGDLPLRFPDSLGTTAKEKQHWQRFWEDQGIGKNCADLVTNIDSWENEKIQSCLTNPHLTALGVVVNTVDDITHGMQLGTAGMHDQVRLWINQRHLSELLVGLAEQSFTIFLTADHGNVAATGMGQPREGLLVKERAKRCRVYQNAKFRTEAKSGFPETFEWPGYGLPPSHHVLLADDLRAFATKNDKSVAHGGIALEEVLVPFVRLKRNPT